MAEIGKPTHVGTRYEIVVHGEFGDLLRAAFADVSVTTGSGNSVLVADVVDHSELYGLLDRLRDFGIDVLSMGRLSDA